MTAQWQNSRQLKERILVMGKLTLETPAHLGTGDSESPIDMPLLRDPLEGKTLLPGSSLAGALRSVLQMQNPSLADRLFGNVTSDESNESYLIVDDALGDVPQIEFRDGVALDPKTRTAADKKKFDFELLQAGTSFDISFELLVPETNGTDLVEALAICLTALEKGEISLGKRKRRGFGRCKAGSWSVMRYQLTEPEGLFQWLEEDRTLIKKSGSGKQTIAKILLDKELALNLSNWCELEADFAIEGSIMIRSGGGKTDEPDMVHLHSIRNGAEIPIVSGTSLGGALRSRALRIAKTLGKDGYEVANSLFGVYSYAGETDLTLTASRIWVDEAEITNPIELVQNRLKIDRFTGGAYPGALFNEQPVFSQSSTGFHLKVRLFEPKSAEVGLLLLLLRDLWLGDLPVGGESSIGRGRLKGKSATLRFSSQEWTIATQDLSGQLAFSGTGSKETLQTYVDDFVNGGK